MYTIYYNPKCSKCRAAMQKLEETNDEIEVIRYLEGNVTREMLVEVLGKLGRPAMDIVRTGEDLWEEKFAGKEYTNDEVIDILVANPSLIQRPLIIKGDVAVIGRSDEALCQII